MSISCSHARKILHDYLDDRRPWANCADMYDVMEEIVNAAELAFTGERQPTKQEYHELKQTVLKLTESFKEHPENYEGPCACHECLEDAN